MISRAQSFSIDLFSQLKGKTPNFSRCNAAEKVGENLFLNNTSAVQEKEDLNIKSISGPNLCHEHALIEDNKQQQQQQQQQSDSKIKKRKRVLPRMAQYEKDSKSWETRNFAYDFDSISSESYVPEECCVEELPKDPLPCIPGKIRVFVRVFDYWYIFHIDENIVVGAFLDILICVPIKDLKVISRYTSVTIKMLKMTFKELYDYLPYKNDDDFDVCFIIEARKNANNISTKKDKDTGKR